MHLRRLLLACTAFLGLTLAARADNVTIQQSVVIRGERALVSLKPGTVVELVSRDGTKAVIRYHGIQAEIPATKLDAPKVEATGTESAAAAPGAEKPAPNRVPQTIPGKAVQKARDVVKQKEKVDAESVPPEMAK